MGAIGRPASWGALLSRALIVTYHAIEPGPAPLCVHPDLFRAHVDAAVSSGARLVSVSELVRELSSPTSGERLVALTFDDAFASVARYAAPILASRGVTATVFCVAGHIGGRNDWASDPAGRLDAPLASTDEIAALASAGIEIGSHGFTHLPATEVSGVALEREIVGSRQALESLTGTEVRSYAYPYGAPPHPEARRLVERTYDAACTTRLALVGERPDVHALPRVDAHYLRRPELLRRTAEGSLGSYLVARRLGSRVRRAFRKDYVTA
jgi:peptidoglycan/xylan/chitin deacetylase (PgdA/CDA1 family)